MTSCHLPFAHLGSELQETLGALAGRFAVSWARVAICSADCASNQAITSMLIAPRSQ